MVSKRVIVGIGFLILAAGILGFAWTQWASSDFDPKSDLEPSTGREPSTYKNHNELLADVAKQVPEFGGFYISDRGTTLNIYLTEDENDPEKREKTQQTLEEMFDVESGLRLNVFKGDYTITRLSEWYELLGTEGIWDQPGVHMTDLDEGRNKLFVGVTSHYDVAGLEDFLDRISIPRKAVTIAVEEPPTNASHALQQAAHRDGQEQQDLLTPEEAKAEGLAQARIAGLVGEPTSVFAEVTTLQQYVFTSSNGTGQLGSAAAGVGWHPDRKVWVVAFRGKVKLTLPSSGGETYDKITLSLDARTGEVIGTDAYSAGETIPYE